MSNNKNKLTKFLWDNSDNLNLNQLEQVKYYSKLILDNSNELDNVTILNLKKFTKLIYNISLVDDSFKMYYPKVYLLNKMGAIKALELSNYFDKKEYLKLSSHFRGHSAEMCIKTYKTLENKIEWLNLGLEEIQISKGISYNLNNLEYYSDKLVQESTILNFIYLKTNKSSYLEEASNLLSESIIIYKNLNLLEKAKKSICKNSEINYKLLKNSKFKSQRFATESYKLYKLLISYYSKEEDKKNLAFANLYFASSLTALSYIKNDKKYAKKAIKSFETFIEILNDEDNKLDINKYKSEIKITNKNLNLLKSKFLSKKL